MRIPFALILIALCAAAQRKQPVTLDALSRPPAGMAAMMAARPIWAPDGQRYVTRQMNRVVLYDVATKTSKDLVTTAEMEKAVRRPTPERAMTWENRRVTEQPLQWSASGKELLVQLFGDVFLVTVETGQWKQLTATETPERDAKLSPDGTRVAFRRGYDLFVLDVAGGKETRLTADGSPILLNAMLDWVYPEELDLGTAYWWSPDSNRIAYLQFDVSREPFYPHGAILPIDAYAEPQRYPKAGAPNAEVRLGVVLAAGGATRWMELGETRDYLLARVQWNADSQSLLVQRLNRVQNQLWVLRAAAAGGQAQTLLYEKDAAWINVADQHGLLKNGELLWSSERDGYRHLYRFDAKGNVKKRLTRGDWEITSIACVDEPGQKIYYVSTEKTPLERHLYLIDFDGKHKRQLSQEAGMHSFSMSPGCRYYTDSWSNSQSPSRTVLRKNDGSEWAVLREADTKTAQEFDLRPVELLNFKGPDGTLFYARLIKPANFDPAKKYPAVVMVYGGPHAQTVTNTAPGLSYDQVLAHKGFVVWQMDNRGSAGRGHQWEAQVNRKLGQLEVADQVAGVKHLLSLGFVDPKRVGVHGWSYGGYMTLLCLLKAPDVFAAGVAGAAVTDWRNYDTIYTERYMGLPAENEAGYKDGSPVHAAANLKGKLMLVHNFEDDNVLFANALQMNNALQEAGKSFEFLLYPGKSHGLTGRARAHWYAEMTRFFAAALGAQ